MVVNALQYRAGFLKMGYGMAWKGVTISVTGLLIPLMVNIPTIPLRLSTSSTTLVDLKVAVGNLAVSGNSSPWMCAYP